MQVDIKTEGAFKRMFQKKGLMHSNDPDTISGGVSAQNSMINPINKSSFDLTNDSVMINHPT